MNPYAEISTVLGKNISSLSESDLRSLNTILVQEINDRIRQKRDSVRSTLKIGSRVTIEDPRCRGKFYIIERFTAKSAVLRQEGNENTPSFMSPKIRATLSLLKSA